MKPTLLVLAAGMGSRYGGLKQMDGLGPNGETIIDYSIYDAVQAGFGKVVYIVREYFKEQMEEVVRQKYSNVKCLDGEPLQFQFVTQELHKIPAEFTLNPERVKPLMMKYYDEVKNWEEDEFEWDNDFEPTLVRKNLWYVDGFYRTYIVKTPSGYKVDWEASEMYNPYTEGQLMNMPNKVVEFRGKVEQTSDYSNDYWVEYLLNDGQNILAVYGRKGSAATKQLSDYVKQKTKHAIIKIKWVPGNNGSFELVEFVREGCSKL